MVRVKVRQHDARGHRKEKTKVRASGKESITAVQT